MVASLSRLFVDNRSLATPVARSGGDQISFARFKADVAGNAARIERAGCRRGLLVTRDVYWGAVGLLALLHAGAEVIIAPDDRSARLRDLVGCCDRLVCDGHPEDGVEALVLEPGGEERALGALDPSAPVAVFTSGSTGEAKQVAKNLALLEIEAETVESIFGPEVPADAHVHGMVPHQHVYGLAFRLCWPLVSGRVFVGSTHRFWSDALMALHGGGVLVTSPAHLSRLDGVAPVAAHRRPSLLLSAGAPLSDAAAGTAATVFGVPVTEIFGSTETGAVAWRRRTLPDSPWRALPGVSVEAGDGGVLQVRSPFVCGEQTFEGADRIAMEADGGFRLLGRIDRVVKIGGKRVSLQEVEDRLRSLPETKAAVVVNFGPPEDRLAAAVVLNEQGKVLLAELGAFRLSRAFRRALADELASASIPRKWRFVETLPCSPLGKLRHGDIAAIFGDDATPATATEFQP